MHSHVNSAVIVAPAYWANYLMHRDPQRIWEEHPAAPEAALRRVDAWIDSIRPWCVRCAQHSAGREPSAYYTAVHDCHGYVDDPGCELAYYDYLAMRL